MPTSAEVRAAIPLPEVVKMQQVSEGLEVSEVFGARVLVEPIVPRTKIDELESEGLIVAPKQVKKDNTPLPSTGIVLKVGNGVLGWASTELQPGAMVMFSKFAGISFMVDKKEFRVLDIGDIACTLRAVEGKSLHDIVQARTVEDNPDIIVEKGRPIIR